MAIYQGTIQLHPKKDGTLLEQKYYKEREEIRDLFAKFKRGDSTPSLVFTRDFEKKYNRSKTSYLPPAPIGIPLMSYYSDRDIDSVEIRYSVAPPKTENGRTRWTKPFLLMDEYLSASENQLDLAWFLLKMCKQVRNGEIKLVDQEVKIDSEWAATTLQADIVKLLLSDERTEDEVQQICDLFGRGDYAFNVNESVRTNALSLWKIVQGRSLNGESSVMSDLMKVLNKVLNIKKEVPEGVVVVDGEEYPLLELPEGWNQKRIHLEAENNNIELPTRPMKNIEKYSILQAKLSKLEPV